MTAELQKLPDDIREAVAPLFDRLPIEKAMQRLVVTESPNDGRNIMLVEQAITKSAVSKRPALQAALWLYVDELDRSHVISQQIDNPTGSFWHGIMHRREGDFGNSHHWFRKAGDHPAMAEVGKVAAEAVSGSDAAAPVDYDAHKLVDEVEAAHKNGESPGRLVTQQRREWLALFNWCANQAPRS